VSVTKGFLEVYSDVKRKIAVLKGLFLLNLVLAVEFFACVNIMEK
jgi:hypothetical protein